jgi:hypothetical protein
LFTLRLLVQCDAQMIKLSREVSCLQHEKINTSISISISANSSCATAAPWEPYGAAQALFPVAVGVAY